MIDAAALLATPAKPPASAPATGASPAPEAAKRAQIAHTARQFEASFLSAMFGQMFEDLDTAAPFGGGQAEGAFRSFLTDAMAKQVSARGGIGLSSAISKEMLKMQGLG